MALVKPKSYSIKEAAGVLGVSERIIRMRCEQGACPAEYHPFPGTQRGFYLLSERSMKWLRENVTPRPRQNVDEDSNAD